MHKEVKMLLHEVLKVTAEKYPNKDAIIYHNRHITYGELDHKSDVLAVSLESIGIKKEGKVALLMPSSIEYVLCAFACWKIGAVLVPINHHYKDREINYILGNSDVSALIFVDKFEKYDYLTRLDLFCNDLPKLKNKICLGKFERDDLIDFNALFDDRLFIKRRDHLLKRQLQITEGDHVLIIYTGGTTGFPKGALISHLGRYHVDYCWGETLHLSKQDRYLCSLPLFHLFAWHGIIAMVIWGGTSVIIDKFEAEESLKIIEKEKISILVQVGTLYLYQVSSPNLEKYNLSSLKGGLGSILNKEDFYKIKEKMGVDITNVYGLTETGGLSHTAQPNDDLELRYSSVGKPIAKTEVKIVSPSREILPVGEVGEIAVKGPATREGYYNDPQKNAEVIDDEGWFYTGDLGYIDKDNYLYLSGREKDMYKQAGENIFPKEIEAVIDSHPKVSISAVIGIPHPQLGEIGKAFIIPNIGVTVTPEEIAEFCRARLASIKVPREIEIRNKLPLTPVGKVDKRTLIEEERNKKPL